MKQNLSQATLLALMESAINHALQLDPGSLKQLARLSGRVIGITSTQPAFTVYLRPHSQGVILQSHYEHQADCHISGTALALVRLISAHNKTQALVNNHISLTGSIELSQQIQAIMAQLDIDWEARLARYVGDIAAHHLGNQARSFYAWSRASTGSMLLNIEEYLHEEARALPARAELDYFYQSIEKLVLDTDRLEARLQRIQQSLTSANYDASKKDHQV